MTKQCLVLGGGSDIGAAIVQALVPDYEVTWSYYNSNRDLPGTAIKCDLRDTHEIDSLFATLDRPLDLMVTAAFPFLECANFDFEGYVEAERFLRGHVYAMTKAAQMMVSRGRILNMLGQCVERGLAGGAFYSAAFAFLHNYGHSINGREGKAGHVSVCDLLLGPVDTREWAGLSEDVVARYKQKVSQFITPRQVAETVRFLASQDVMPSTYKLDAYYGY